ncbi:MAG: TldD/PmbA family protein [Candidatus Saganbacteria bacterium]|nr:TldD/PmbA family protein [Candidatus Saganbacteria bacterium]
MTDLIKSSLINFGADFADVFTEEVSSTSIVIEDARIDKLIAGSYSGKGIRAMKGLEVDYEYYSQKETAPEKPDIPIDKKIALVEKADRAARKISPLIRQVSISYGDTVQKVTCSNSLGIHAKGTRIRTRFVVSVIASNNGVLQTGYETAGASTGFELFEKVDVEKMGVIAAERAVMMLGASAAPSGKMAVIIMSEAGGTLIHEACGHGLEADFIVKNTSVYGGKTGQKVASELITVIDDATIPGAYGSFEFDDEGTPSQKKILIENGILKGFMSDIYNSRILNIGSSGNGRREDFQQKPQPRMTNTYIERGNSDPGEIISSVKNGLLVKKLGGGQVNVTNGDFVFEVQEGYVIENGKIKRSVRGATLIGNGPKILAEIDMVGSDLHFIIGTCGKGDHAPVSDAMPTVRVPEIVVGGRA